MEYVKQQFTSGQKLKAEHLNYMEEGIAQNSEAINNKQENLVSGISIKTINGENILGAGNLVVSSDGNSSASSLFKGKTIAVLGDSISTQLDLNAVEMRIEESDIGVKLSAYPTYYDVQDGLSLGDHTFVSADIGKEVVFTPTAQDVGKVIGKPLNYNKPIYVKKTWWQIMAETFECDVTPVCWSGSSISSHSEGNNIIYKTAHAWHDAQIRKLGKRKPGSMTRVAPDLVLIYRGCNDMTHLHYSKLTSDYFENVQWTYPTTDVLADGYGYKEALSLTIGKIRAAYPSTQIVLCTNCTFKRIDFDNFPTTNGLYTLPMLNKAIREAAQFFGCHTVDFDKMGITFENCFIEGYITDSTSQPTHPNTKGHAIMGAQAVKDLTNKISVILNNSTEYTPSIPE